MKTGVYSFEAGKEPKDLEKQIKVLKEQLKVAVEALESYRDGQWWYGREWQEDCLGWEIACEALAKIKELGK